MYPGRVSAKPIAPPALPDLPESLRRGGPIQSIDHLSLERTLLEGADLSGATSFEARLEQCRLIRVDLSGASLSRVLMADISVEGGSWANVRTEELRFNRVAFKGVRMTGASLASASLEDVSFADCRIDLAFFASARLKRVRFRGCQMDEADFFGSKLDSVVFDGCSLIRGRWTDAVVTRAEMRRCDLTGSIDLVRLRGLRMPMADVLVNAAELAAALGFEILDESAGGEDAPPLG
jgi:uncharacterized protein YjbI with pentapeptide repeats